MEQINTSTLYYFSILQTTPLGDTATIIAMTKVGFLQ